MHNMVVNNDGMAGTMRQAAYCEERALRASQHKPTKCGVSGFGADIRIL